MPMPSLTRLSWLSAKIGTFNSIDLLQRPAYLPDLNPRRDSALRPLDISCR